MNHASIERLEHRRMLAIVAPGIPQWISQGPAPIVNGQAPDGSSSIGVVGKTNAIATDPFNPDLLFVGTDNGGIWRTQNATADPPTWTPLTDYMPSPGIGDVEISPFDALGNPRTAATPLGQTVVYASLATLTTGLLDLGLLSGLMRSTDGGATWQPLANTAPSVPSTVPGGVAGRDVLRVIPTAVLDPATGKQVILVITDNNFFRSTDGGVSFVTTSGLSLNFNASACDYNLEADPKNPNIFYAGIPARGVFRSTDAGLTWSAINNGPLAVGNIITSSNCIELAVHPTQNFIYAAIWRSGSFSGMFRSPDGGTSWEQLAAPLSLLGQTGTIAADPSDPDIVWLTAGPEGVHRGRFSAGIWSDIQGGAVGFPHADGRDLVFNFGDLLETDDGGIFRLTDPDDTNPLVQRRWHSMVNNLSAAEVTSVSYDSLNNVLFAGLWDNGSNEQQSPGSASWNHWVDGDGLTTAWDNSTGPTTFRYGMGNGLRQLFRRQFNASGAPLGGRERVALNGLNPNDAMNANALIQWPFVLNSQPGASNRFLLGGNGLYESVDRGDNLTDITPAGFPGGAQTLLYGGRTGGVSNPSLLYVGALFGDGARFYRRTSGTGPPTLAATPGNGVLKMVLDPDDADTVYALDFAGHVWRTTTGGVGDSPWQDLTGNLPTLHGGARSIQLIKAGGNTVVLVGALGGVFRAVNPTAASSVWSEFGRGLPNVIVEDLRYDPSDDLLIAGTYGRGVWTLPNASASAALPGDVTITGTGIDDSVTLLRHGSRVLISADLGGVPSQADLEFNAISHISINLGAGNDSLTLFYSGGDPIPGGSLDYDGGTNAGPLPADQDTLTVFGTSNADALALNAAMLSVGTTQVNYANTEQMVLSPGAGDDTIGVSRLGGSPLSLRVDTGAGSDQVNLTATTADLTPSTTGVIVNGQGTSTPGEIDRVTLTDTISTNPWTITDSRVLTVSGSQTSALLSYDDIDQLTVNLSAAANTIDIQSTRRQTPVTINAGAGADQFTVNANTALGDLDLNGGPPFTSLGDSLHVNGTLLPGGIGAPRLQYTPGAPGSGSITVFGRIYRFTGIEEMVDLAGFADLAIDLSNFNSGVPVNASAFRDADFGYLAIIATDQPVPPPILRLKDVGSLTLATADWVNDTLTIQKSGFLLPGLQEFRYVAGAGSDTLNVFGPLTLTTIPAGLFRGLAVTVNDPGAMLALTSSQRMLALNVLAGRVTLLGSGDNLLRTGFLAVAPGASVDLGSNSLRLDTTDLLRDADAKLVRSLVALARNGGPKLWQDAGLTSSAAAADPSKSLGMSISDTSIRVVFTLAGDTNLDKSVNFSDLVALAQNYNGAGGFPQGDLNYDDNVDFKDLVILAQTYNTALLSLPVTSPTIAASPVGASLNRASRNSIFSVVPVAKPVSRRPKALARRLGH
jgi:hypothetical protein